LRMRALGTQKTYTLAAGAVGQPRRQLTITVSSGPVRIWAWILITLRAPAQYGVCFRYSLGRLWQAEPSADLFLHGCQPDYKDLVSSPGHPVALLSFRFHD